MLKGGDQWLHSNFRGKLETVICLRYLHVKLLRAYTYTLTCTTTQTIQPQMYCKSREQMYYYSIYLQWTLYSSHSCTYWCLCSFSVCPDVFVWRNCVWEQNKLIIHEEFPLALFLKLLTVLPSISLLAVFPHLF